MKTITVWLILILGFVIIKVVISMGYVYNPELQIQRLIETANLQLQLGILILPVLGVIIYFMYKSPVKKLLMSKIKYFCLQFRITVTVGLFIGTILWFCLPLGVAMSDSTSFFDNQIIVGLKRCKGIYWFNEKKLDYINTSATKHLRSNLLYEAHKDKISRLSNFIRLANLSPKNSEIRAIYCRKTILSAKEIFQQKK